MKGQSHQIVTSTTQHIEKEIEKTYNRSQFHPMPISTQDNLKKIFLWALRRSIE